MAAPGDTVTVQKGYGYGDGTFRASPDAQYSVVAQYPGPAIVPPGAGMPYRGGPVNVLQPIDILGNVVALSQFSIEDTYCDVVPPGP